jgi:hypothetical protein
VLAHVGNHLVVDLPGQLVPQQISNCSPDRLWLLSTASRVRRAGRHLRPDQAAQRTEDFFHAHGLYRLRGTIRYPAAA